VSIACVGLFFGAGLTMIYYENRDIDSLLDQSTAMQALANEMGELRGHHSLLNERLLAELTIARQFPALTQEPDDDESLASRIEKIELDHARANAMRVSKEEQPTAIEMIEQLNAQSAAGQGRSNPRAEALYQSDYGAGDAYTEGLITQTFERAADLNVQSIQCKSTICRVSYNSAGPQDPSSEWHPEADMILSQLSDELGRNSISVHHARDSLGNKLMYIETR
jgi:hypothetical protein